MRQSEKGEEVTRDGGVKEIGEKVTRDGGVEGIGEGVREREVTWDGGVEEIGEAMIGYRGERFHSGSGTGDSATGVEGIREVVTRDGGVEEIGEEVIRDVRRRKWGGSD